MRPLTVQVVHEFTAQGRHQTVRLFGEGEIAGRVASIIDDEPSAIHITLGEADVEIWLDYTALRGLDRLIHRALARENDEKEAIH